MYQPFCKIVPLDRYNWEQCLDIQLTPEQSMFVPTILYSLAQAKFEELHPYGIMNDNQMVGFIMYGEFAGICWINRIMIDIDYQRKGIGRTAMQQLLELLNHSIRCKEIRASYAKENNFARQFFLSVGFKPLSEGLDDEEVVIYEDAK